MLAVKSEKKVKIQKSKLFILLGAIAAALYSFWPTSTEQDFKRVQKFLSRGKRPELKLLGDMEKRIRKFRIIGDKPDEMPEQGTVPVNCSADERENCLIVYASLNKGFPLGVKRLVNYVKNSDFKGHILYRIGGWPNVEEGDLKLAHVPYAFKPCFFREAKRLGYQRALWLDASILPRVSLNSIFDEIQRKGYFVMGGSGAIAPFMNEQAARDLNVTLDECSAIPSCSAGLFGVDFTNETASKSIDLWYQAAKAPYAFFSPRSDQNALSVILHHLGMRDFVSIETLAETHREIPKGALFIIDRGFVHH